MTTQFEILPTSQEKAVIDDAEFEQLLRKAVDELSR